MKKINRQLFIKKSMQLGALALLSPLTNNLHAATTKPFQNVFDDEILKRFSDANDKEVAKFLAIRKEQMVFSRRTGYQFAALASSYVYKNSKYFKSPLVLAAIKNLIPFLVKAQTADGTVNIGNLESPPDTAFLLEPLVAGAHILSKENTTALARVNNEIKSFIVKAADALSTGGVHTPNHRWVVCAALAQVNALYPNQKYTDRIEEWLSEGIFIDSDGNFPERSRNYDVVENASLLTMGRLLNRQSLFDPVIKNLQLTYYYMEPNGDLVTVNSRRQDQYTSISIASFYLHYRYLSIKDGNGMFAAIARQIENMPGFEELVLSRYFFHFLENPLLQQNLPAGVSPPVKYEKLLSSSDLLRIRDGNSTTTLFGGVDWPLIIASGRSNSPNFFSFRKGNAILKYMRLSTSFFSTGYFYSNGLKKQGEKYILYNKLEAPYYQPLPKDKIKTEGDYTLSPSVDGRFWNKMDFNNRRVSNVKTLETKVLLLPGANEVEFEVTGQAGVYITIELCFNDGGKLTGVSKAEAGNSFLEKGNARYEFGGDAIEFGPGAFGHKNIKGLEGERYGTHFGSLRTEGMHVYLTGVTPFHHKLVFG